MLTGAALAVPLVVDYLTHDFALAGDLGTITTTSRVTGLLFMIVGFATFTFTLLLHADAASATERGR